MNIDQTKRPEGEEGEDLIVEELFVEDYGSPPTTEEAKGTRGEPKGIRKQAHRMKDLVKRSPKRSLLGLVLMGGVAIVGMLFARGRRRHASMLSRAFSRLGYTH